ncbi:peptidase T [Thorsellia kenyensis]|uniref:Peptidase T n=1 Tax=Thorsellia kenyensis TaxID=1549888 RepID=A0ABV6CAV5_9GAMM
MTTPIQQKLKSRFFNYLSITSQSDASATQVPSTKGQWDMAHCLAKELTELNCLDVHIDEYANVTARIPGNTKNAYTIGFCAHTDTVDVGLNPDIKPQVLTFTGSDLCLNSEKNIWLRVNERPEIKKYLNEEIIFSDGTSVLGADNKAAITAVMEMVAYFNENPDTPHGDIYISFVSDEEIGLRGSKLLDLSRFKVDFAYTIDCCETGELIYETFNAGTAFIHIEGVTAHPMSAKNVLVNPLRIIQDLMGCFDIKDTPEHTEGREGYFWFNSLQANQNEAKAGVSIRDFDLTNYEKRKQFLMQQIEKMQKNYPTAKINCHIEDVYSNIANSLQNGGDTTSIDLLKSVFQTLQIEPKIIPMRGGTDGSALAAKGVITPNYFTGAHNFHSAFEFLPLKAFEKSYKVTLELCKAALKK